MSMSPLRKQPISQQIAAYQTEMANIEANIEKGKARIKELQKLIRTLQRPDAEATHRKRMAQSQHDQRLMQQRQQALALSQSRKEEALARNRARIELELEQCLRLNGKI